MSETLTIQSAVSIDLTSVRQVIRDGLPVARFIATRLDTLGWGWAPDVVDALQAIVDSDPLWKFFEPFVAVPEGAALSVEPMSAEAAADADKADLSPEVIIALLPVIIELAQWLIAGIRKRRGG